MRLTLNWTLWTGLKRPKTERENEMSITETEKIFCKTLILQADEAELMPDETKRKPENVWKNLTENIRKSWKITRLKISVKQSKPTKKRNWRRLKNRWTLWKNGEILPLRTLKPASTLWKHRKKHSWRRLTNRLRP